MLFITSGCNKFRQKILDEKIKEKELVYQSNNSNLVKNSDLNSRPAILATKSNLKEEKSF